MAVHRTAAGSDTDLSEHVALFEEQIAGLTPEELEAAAPNLSLYPSAEAYLRACNPSIARPTGAANAPANFVHYLDVNSLYGSSGE